MDETITPPPPLNLTDFVSIPKHLYKFFFKNPPPYTPAHKIRKTELEAFLQKNRHLYRPFISEPIPIPTPKSLDS